MQQKTKIKLCNMKIYMYNMEREKLKNNEYNMIHYLTKRYEEKKI